MCIDFTFDSSLELAFNTYSEAPHLRDFLYS